VTRRLIGKERFVEERAFTRYLPGYRPGEQAKSATTQQEVNQGNALPKLAAARDAREPYLTIFKIAWSTGLGGGEILGLTAKDIDFDRRVIPPESKPMIALGSSGNSKPRDRKVR
jgi:integrase